MRFPTSTVVVLGSLVQAQAQLHRTIGVDGVGNEPFILTSTTENALEDDPIDWEDPALRFGGVLTTFSVLEGTGCPAGTFTPQPIEAGKSSNTYVDFTAFDYNSTTNEGPATCSITFDFEYTIPERGYGSLYPQLHTVARGWYEENDTERGTNFNVGELFNIKAGPDEFADAPITMTFINVDQTPEQNLQTGAIFQQTGTAGEKRTGSFRVDYSVYTSFGVGAMKIARVATGFGLEDA